MKQDEQLAQAGQDLIWILLQVDFHRLKSSNQAFLGKQIIHLPELAAIEGSVTHSLQLKRSTLQLNMFFMVRSRCKMSG